MSTSNSQLPEGWAGAFAGFKSLKVSVFSCYGRIFYALLTGICFCLKMGFECVFIWYHIKNSATYIAVYYYYISSFHTSDKARKPRVLMTKI